ncbi:nucleotidyltransferase domain-containing protein [bacterium]|nr:MAG: nucleotidyltransferase domain-containing protein [bacterium]
MMVAKECYNLFMNFDLQQARKLGIKLAVLFGSQAEGTARSDSDTDVAVLTDKQATYTNFTNIYEYFSNIYGSTVDVRFLNDSDPLFRYQVFKNGQLLIGNNNDFIKEKILAHKMYIDDVLPYQDLFMKKIKNNQKQLENDR